MMWNITPLEQFEIRVVKEAVIKMLDLSYTGSSMYLVLIGLCWALLFSVGTRYKTVFMYTGQRMVELVYRFVYEILLQQASVVGAFFFPILSSIFAFILLSNSLGLTGFGFTVTSHIVINFIVAVSFNGYYLIMGFFWHRLGFLRLFVPRGLSPTILPLIVVIEVLSYLIRTISLSVRLFANMLAGHTLLFIFASFVVAFIKTPLYKVVGLLPFAFLFAIFVLEIGIAFLQAYVFTLILAIYLKDSLSPSH